MQEIQRRLDVGEQSKATTSVGGRGKYCWDCCSHRLLFSQRNMVCCKRTNALLWFVNIKLWKEIQLKFFGRHDKKALFLRHFPDKLQEQDGATHDKEGPSPCGVDYSLPYKHNIFWPQKPNITLHMWCTPAAIAVHSTLLYNVLRDEESHSSSVVTKREVHLHTL